MESKVPLVLSPAFSVVDLDESGFGDVKICAYIRGGSVLTLRAAPALSVRDCRPVSDMMILVYGMV